MKKLFNLLFVVLVTALLTVPQVSAWGQAKKQFVREYLKQLPDVPFSHKTEMYRMTAVYTNRDLYGNFTGKMKVTGDYTWGLPGDSVKWNNVFISSANGFDEPFPAAKKQEYMEGIKYVPTPEILKADMFKNFPKSPENVYSRNLLWDMYTFEIFGWKFYDSLKLNKPYIVSDINGQFDMAEIGKYRHNKIILCWRGVTEVNGEMCAVIDFDAIDNMLEINMDIVKTKGTEQYWGTIMLSLKDKSIAEAVMYSGSMQEIEVQGMKDKFLVKTIREIEVNRIQ
jgi:hypothetical protein